MVTQNTHSALQAAADQSPLGIAINFPLTTELCRMLDSVTERTGLEGAELLGYLLYLEESATEGTK